MNIAATQFTLSQKSFDIYISGCKLHPCKGCHNPELWDENYGDILTQKKIDEIKEKIKKFSNIISKVCIYGGEPLEKPLEDLLWLLSEIKETNKEIWLFTRFDINDVPKILFQYIDYIKCGEYIEELKTDNNIQYGVKLATSNQKIYKKGVDYL